MHDVLAVVIVYKSAAVIGTMLESLGREAGSGLRVVVVDNSSDAVTAELVADLSPGLPFELEYMASRNVGYAGGFNRGLERLRPTDKAVLVLNPDLVFMSGALRVLERTLVADGSVAIVLPAYVDDQGKRVAYWTELPRPGGYWRWALLGSRQRKDSTGSAVRNVEWGPGACMLVRGDAVREVGGMDDRIFLFMEDADWCHRFLEQGWSVRIAPDALVAHEWGHAAAADARRVLQTHLAKLYYFQKWYGRRGLLLATAQMAIECILKIGYDGLARSHPERLSGYSTLLRVLPSVVEEGPISVQNRMVSRD